MKTKMKRFYIFLLLSEIVCFLVLFFFYPYTIQMQEGESLFLFTKEFVGGVISRPQGICFLVVDFLEQFFSTAWTGALVYSLVVTLSQWFLFLSLRNLGKQNLYWLSFLPAFVVVPFSFPFLDMTVNFMFFSLLLYVFTAIRQRGLRCVYALLLPMPAFCLITWYEAAMLFAVFAAVEMFYRKDRISAAVMVAAFGPILSISCHSTNVRLQGLKHIFRGRFSQHILQPVLRWQCLLR